jgi:hypothetical protein
MTSDDLAVRNATYRLFAQLGRPPSVDEVAAATRQPSDFVGAAWQRLHDVHALVLDDKGRLRMANPFSAVETPHRVDAAGRSWFANCGWDAFGIGAALRIDSTIHTTCADCGDTVDLTVRGFRPTDTTSVFHVLVPARAWWDDIGYT